MLAEASGQAIPSTVIACDWASDASSMATNREVAGEESDGNPWSRSRDEGGEAVQEASGITVPDRLRVILRVRSRPTALPMPAWAKLFATRPLPRRPSPGAACP